GGRRRGPRARLRRQGGCSGKRIRWPAAGRWHPHRDRGARSADPGESRRSDADAPAPRTVVAMLRLYNTLTRQEEPFAPVRDNLVRMYACGLTVYARGHIGNFRTFVCVDVLRRTLKYLTGYDVKGVINYTDVDD